MRLDEYLDPTAEQGALTAEYEWIKQLRGLDVDGHPLRRRFTFRGDSLWWFSELYLHKQQTILNVFRTIAALEALHARDNPRVIRIESGGAILERWHLSSSARRAFGTKALRVSRRSPYERCD